jgi:15-cis-phytoene synthase
MNEDVVASYRHCRQVVRRAASNFGWAFWLLPADERRSMDALYAFARVSDDLTDGPGTSEEKRHLLSQCRDGLEQSLAGKPTGPLFPALADTVARHRVPPEYLRQIVTGVEMDLDHRGYETFADLRNYCEHVASAVGLACLAIWDCRDERAIRPATDCGVAFQLTNILRDQAEDVARDRMYLPREDLAQFADRFGDLIRFECLRASALYDSSAETERFLSGPGRRLFKLMHATYRALLGKIERDPAAVLHRRQRVSRPHKAWLAMRTLLS